MKQELKAWPRNLRVGMRSPQFDGHWKNLGRVRLSVQAFRRKAWSYSTWPLVLTLVSESLLLTQEDSPKRLMSSLIGCEIDTAFGSRCTTPTLKS